MAHCVLDLALKEDFYSARSEKPRARNDCHEGYGKVGRQGALLAHLSEREIFLPVVRTSVTLTMEELENSMNRFTATSIQDSVLLSEATQFPKPYEKIQFNIIFPPTSRVSK